MLVRQDIAHGSDGVAMPRVCVSVSIPDFPAELVYNFLRDKARSASWHRDVASAVEVTDKLGEEARLEQDAGVGHPGAGLASLRLWLTRYKVPAAAKHLGIAAREILERRICSAADAEAYLIAGSSTGTELLDVPVSLGHRRAHLTMAATAVVPRPEGGCELRSVTHMNPGSAPAWIVQKLPHKSR